MKEPDAKPRNRGLGIVVRNLDRKYKLNEKFLKKLTRKIFHILKKPRNTDLEVIFLSDAAIRSINRRYKHSNRATDVLSFDLGSFAEIFISPETAIKNCRIFGTSFEKELILYIIHGILHLYGYDDRTPILRMRMSKKENSILEKICAKANLSKVLTRR